MARNPLGKTRKVEDPYAVFKLGAWEIRILKTYRLPKNEKTNQYAAWYTAAKSPHTFGSWEYGDAYIQEIKDNFPLVESSKEWKEVYQEDFAVK
tara:strand:- start:48 stop:329 length:282 start_codon:yes stop_codon:yes gene_type:complete